MMPKLLQDLSFPAIMAGFITCMIGISVSAVLVIEAAQSLVQMQRKSVPGYGHSA
jgi:hypothetical protein